MRLRQIKTRTLKTVGMRDPEFSWFQSMAHAPAVSCAALRNAVVRALPLKVLVPVLFLTCSASFLLVDDHDVLAADGGAPKLGQKVSS